MSNNIIRILVLVLALISGTVDAQNSKLTSDFKKISTANPNVRILTSGEIKVHSYVNPQLIQVTSYVLELKDSLVIIDAQLTYTFTKEVVDYAKGLNKPIARVIITHAHPDHFLGVYAFKDLPVYALEETKNTIQQTGEAARQVFLKNFGEKDAAPEVLIPSHILTEGITTINKVNFLVRKVKNNEADVIAIIELPKSKIIITGDFIYNQVHLFPGNNHLQEWKNQLEQQRLLFKGKIILPGHGYPSDASLVNENINYLTKAIQVSKMTNMNAALYKVEMVKAFPDYGASILIDFGAYALFQ